MKYFFNFLFVVLTFGAKARGNDSTRISSPNGFLSFDLKITDTLGLRSGLIYRIDDKDEAVILPSQLGIKSNPNTVSNTNWYEHLVWVRSEKKDSDQTWVPVLGENSRIRDHYNELTITFRSSDPKIKGNIQLVVRAYDEGIAFRYRFPEQFDTQVLEIGSELTSFRFAEGTSAYYTDHAQGKYQKRPLKDWKNDAELPLTLGLKNERWVCMSQACQINYPRIRFKTTSENTLTTNLYGEVVESSPFATPWHVIMVAENPRELADHNFMISNLNEPNRLSDVSWIKPGQVIREMTLSTTGAKKLIDFAQDQHAEYILFDAGWYGPEYQVASDATKVNVDPARNPVNALDMQEVIRYAKSKGKGVILYVNRRAAERQLDTILPLYQQWGIAGIKLGFVQTGSQQWNTWLFEAVKKAAAYHLMVDVHDEFSPSGYNRTYPNLVTQEGIRGNEEFPDATHNTILPFTRMIAGPADYTPCFRAEGTNRNTKCHQLALPVVLFSPWQSLYFYDKPEAYPDRVEIEFWKALPSTWDESHLVDGQPGEYVVSVRRKDKDWYVGGITNNEPREMKLDLDFLPKGKTFEATLYEDDGSGKVKNSVVKIRRGDTLKFHVLAKGGFAIHINGK